jgi:hypothetical protein
MKTYRIEQSYTKIDYWYEIKAENEDEAREIAMKLRPDQTEFVDDTETEITEIKNKLTVEVE